MFVIWQNARNKEKEIIEEIKNNFSILEVYEIDWHKKNFKHYLERFYCAKIRKKIKQTGTGKFLLVTVRDDKPLYQYEQTLKGYEIVNSKVLSLKQKVRKLTGGGYKIHSTNDIKETDANLVFILGKSYKEYYEYALNKTFTGNYIQFNEQPAGADAWKNLDEVFKVLNSSCSYVVLRGFDEKGGDIDLLVDNFDKVRRLLNAEKVHKQKYRLQVKTKVENEDMLFDLSCVGDNYYCEKWQQDMLNHRIYDERGFYVPNNDDLLNTLIYHSLFHKRTLSHKYDEFIKELFSKTSNINVDNDKNPYDMYIQFLYKYMYDNDYYVSTPNDKKVKFNKTNIRKMEWIHLLSSKYGFKNIKTFSVSKKPSSGFEFFFLADYNEEKVFIKCGNGNFDAKKEFEAYNYLNKQNSQYFPKAYMYRNLADNKMFLCIEYIEGTALSEELVKQTDINKLSKMFNSLYSISDILYKNKFIHRDVNSGNLIVKDDGTIVLIDFQHLIGNCFKENPENIINPKKLRGTNKHLRPYPFVWDEMYSLYNILKVFDGMNIEHYTEKMSELKSRIGQQRYFFFDNKFPLEAYFRFNLLFVYKTINTILKPFRKLIP